MGGKIYDFIVIGSGVVGSAVARELSKYKVNVAVLEKNYDVCFETSGRNSGVVHAGFSYDVGSLKSKLCLEGNLMFEEISETLDVPFKRCGKLLVGNTEEDLNTLKKVIIQAKENNVSGMSLINESQLHKLVPAAIGKYGVFSKNSGVVDPFIFNIALAENASLNSVSYYFNNEVLDVKYIDNKYEITTNNGKFFSRWVINSAGLNCGVISSMVGIDDYKIIGSKGEYIVLNKSAGDLLPMPIYPVPSNTYMGIHVTNTVDGNVLVGPDAENTLNFTDYSVVDKNIKFLEKSANTLWPHVNKKDYIRTYAGILPKWVYSNGNIQDFKIERIDNTTPNFINLIGIESPGLTAAIPIAKYVLELIKEKENLKNNNSFNPERKGITKFSNLNFKEKENLIKSNPQYGEIICRCEKVSKSEIIQAINNPLNVCTLASIKYRTRSMTGQCQGGYCQMRITDLIEEYKKINFKDIKYKGIDSNIFTDKTRKGV